MSTDTSTTPEATTSEASTTPVTFEKNSWQDKMSKSAGLADRSAQAKKRAGVLLWEGAQTGITEWLPSAATDVSAEGFYATVKEILGDSRKGDANKIKNVALAVRNHGLDLAVFPNLSRAYAEAKRLLVTQQAEANEDSAADEAVALIEAPKTASAPESAALILLSKGIDGAVVAILDALGDKNFDAHRAFVRAVSTEVAARVQAAKPKPEPKAPVEKKAGATKATGAKATPKSGAAKAKPAAAKAKPVATSATKGDPNKRVLPTPNATKAKPVQASDSTGKGEPVTEPVHAGDDTLDIEAPVAPVKKAVKRAVPVRR